MTTVDLDSCAREPIHIPGAIQGHGCLVATDHDFNITHFSSNSANHLRQSINVNQPLSAIMGSSLIDQVSLVFAEDGREDKYHYCETLLEHGVLPCLAHRVLQGYIFEFGKPSVDSTAERFSFYPLSRLLAIATGSQHLRSLLEKIANELKSFLAIDRVMIYRFDDDWNGEVIAESKESSLEPYLGLHYPVSDIPAQARQLYTRNWLRIIPNVNYLPIAIVPDCGPQSNSPLDLSDSILRSISPLHIQYLQNMKVAATVVMSLIVNGKLWGLIACHHYAAHHVSLKARYFLEILAKIISNAIQASLQQEITNAINKKALILDEINLNILKKWNLSRAFLQPEHGIQELLTCDGVAIIENQKISVGGHAPSNKSINSIARWLDTQQKDLFFSNELSKDIPDVHVDADVAGVLAIKLGKAPADYVFWFRKERIAHINWAGDPDGKVLVSPDTLQLSPRKSFALFKQEVRGKSLRWQEDEIHTARQLKAYVLEFFAFEKIRLETLVAEKTGQLAKSLQMVEEAKILAEQNSALKNHMLASMSHEVRTPLNGIMGMAHLIKLKSQDTEVNTYVSLILQSGERLLKTLTPVLELAEVEAQKRQLNMGRCNLAEILREVVEVLTPLASSKKIALSLHCNTDDISVNGDATIISQIFYNLVENAVKYTLKGTVSIEVNERTLKLNPFITVQVKDTGIGISRDFIQQIFEPFTQESMGMSRTYEGVGLGLSLTKRYVDLSGGMITVESEKGAGSTFEVMLPKTS